MAAGPSAPSGPTSLDGSRGAEPGGAGGPGGPDCAGCSLAPLTGLPTSADLSRSALVVKIDNLDLANESARPQSGINQADVVIEEVVEAGITRLMAVFHSTDADPVGPVRSARTSDVHLLPQFHRPLFAWSGGNDGVIAAVAAAPVADVGSNGAPRAYDRAGPKAAPHNLYTNTSVLWSLTSGGAGPPTPLWSFRRTGEPLPASAQPMAGLSIGFTYSPTSYAWNGDGWTRSQNGSMHTDSHGEPVAPANVVVLFTQYGSSPADSRSPEAITTGSGEAWVFTAGHLVRGRWDRPSEGQPSRLTDGDGTDIALTPGRTWVELAPPGSAAVF